MEKRRARLIVALTAAVALVAGPGLWQGAWMSWREHALATKQRRVEALYRSLQAERQRLSSDPVYVEGLIRSTFKVAKPDEIVLPLDGSDTSAR